NFRAALSVCPLQITKAETSLQYATNSRILRLVYSTLEVLADFLRSESASFGFRAACCALSATIPAFLHNTATFYVQTRAVWISIIISLTLSPTTGASL